MTRDLLKAELPVVETGDLLLPLAASLILTGAVAAMLCQPPAHTHALSFLFALAALYLVIAALGHAFAVWLVRKLFDDELPWPTEALIVGLWSTVAWLPMLSLLTARNSLWVAATLPFLVNSAARFLRRSSIDSSLPPSTAFTLFHPAQELAFWRLMLPAALTSAALEGGTIALFLEHPWLAGSCFAAGIWLPVWRLVQAPQDTSLEPGRSGAHRVLLTSLAAWLLTTAALLPFASGGLLAEALRSIHLVTPSTHRALVPHKALPASPGSLQFVILLQPARPHAETVAPPVATSHGSSSGAEPVVIPFDGPYWFYKVPGEQPPLAARRVKGDPRQVNIRSTDALPILMEAHQSFEPPLQPGSARTLRVQLTNADDRPGTINLEVILRTSHGQHSLGTLPLQSSSATSVHLGRPAVQETLSFPLQPAGKADPIEAITIRFKPDRSRNMAAPLVAIQSFTLQP